MYYFIKGICHDDENAGDAFEWVICADSKDAALTELDETDEILELREISVEERIQREESALSDNIKREYLINHYGDRSLREFSQIQKKMETDKELYYSALVEHNRIMRFKKRLLRFINKKTMTIEQFDKALLSLCGAKDEKEFNAILAKAAADA